MADYTWPATLPQEPLEEGYQESPPDLTVRTKMDAGPAKVRRRATAGVRNVPGVRFGMTTAQVSTFDDFFVSTLSHGASAFNWDDPRTGSTCEWRFTATPTYKPSGPGHWIVECNLEQMP